MFYLFRLRSWFRQSNLMVQGSYRLHDSWQAQGCDWQFPIWPRAGEYRQNLFTDAAEALVVLQSVPLKMRRRWDRFMNIHLFITLPESAPQFVQHGVQDPTLSRKRSTWSGRLSIVLTDLTDDKSHSIVWWSLTIESNGWTILEPLESYSWQWLGQSRQKTLIGQHLCSLKNHWKIQMS